MTISTSVLALIPPLILTSTLPPNVTQPPSLPFTSLTKTRDLSAVAVAPRPPRRRPLVPPVDTNGASRGRPPLLYRFTCPSLPSLPSQPLSLGAV